MGMKTGIVNAWRATTWTTRGFVLAALGIAGAVAVSFLTPAPPPLHTTPPPTAPVATAPKIDGEREAGRMMERRRQDVVWEVTRRLQSALRDPDSVRWHEVVTNDDASVVCLDYGATNGFGGITREQIVIHTDGASKETKDWNRLCTKGRMHDLKLFAPRP